MCTAGDKLQEILQPTDEMFNPDILSKKNRVIKTKTSCMGTESSFSRTLYVNIQINTDNQILFSSTRFTTFHCYNGLRKHSLIE